MASRAARHAKGAREAADDARTTADAIASNLERHYNRVEASYETSREATLSLLAYLQGESRATQRFTRGHEPITGRDDR
jgi:hypothetical protein